MSLDPSYGMITARFDKVSYDEAGRRSAVYADLKVSPCAVESDVSQNFDYISSGIKELVQLRDCYCIDQDQPIDLTLEGLPHNDV